MPRSVQVHPRLRCPQCGECGFVVPDDPGVEDEVYGAVCHCCGHFMDRQELMDALAGWPDRGKDSA